MPVAMTDAQSLERNHRSTGEHLKSSAMEFHTIQPLSQLHQWLNLKESVEVHIMWTMKKEDLEICTHLQICTHLHGCNLTGMIEMWWDGSYDSPTSSLGRTGRGDDEALLSPVSVTSRSAWSSIWMRRWLRAYGSRFRGGQGQVTLWH